ncbi:MAG: hypothetical protein SH868_05720 [Bythopirellula sp.]|nr:hypothetical protein [Bythopirellula sp.]
MKSERRHDLETNQLAVQVQDLLDRAKPYASQIALVIVGLIALAYIGSMWGSASSSTEQSAWDEFTLASYSTDPDLNSMKLLAENEEYTGTSVPEWAYLAWSDRQVLLASQSYLTDRTTTNKRLEQVLPLYQALDKDSDNSQIQDRARFGMAQVLEMQGKVEEARAAYARVKGDLSALADDRAEQLDSPEVKAACDWLATAELPKREVPSTSGAALGTRPNFDAEVPAPQPNKTPITDTRTLEEIIEGQTSPAATDKNRYGEAEEAEAEPEATATEAEANDADEPATDAAGP